MPNVMGREFPYTPEGMAAAEQYRRTFGMRDGGMLGFRPIGYAEGDLVESVRPALQQGVSAVMGAPVDLVNAGLGSVGLGSTTPVGGEESISNAIDTVSSLVQQFTEQGIPEPVKNAVNAAIETYGIPVDLVNSALRAIGVPVSDNPIGGSKNLRETFGMRDGGMMGLRPIGMQEGGAPLTKRQKIELIKKLTGVAERYIRTMSEKEMDNTIQQLEAEAAAKEQDRRRRGDPTTWGEQPTWGEQSPQGQPDITAPLDRYPMDEALQQLETSAPFLEGVLLPPEPMPPEPYFNPDDIAVANGGYITRNRNRGGIMSLRRR